MALDKSAKCLTCGYCLWGLPTQISPECGRAFNPADASSYQGGTFVPNWRRWAVPPGVWEIAFTLAATVHAMFVRSSAVGGFDDIPIGLPCLTVLLLIVLAVLWIARAVAFIADRDRAARDIVPRARRTWRWWLLPVVLVVLGSTFAGNWPLRARFALSRTAFEAEARSLLAGSASARAAYPRFVGPAFRVSHVEVDAKGTWVVFFVDVDLIDYVGFAYSPAAPMGKDVGLPPGWYVYED